jgi:hypothetical protein
VRGGAPGALLVATMLLGLAGCSAILESPPVPDPASFPEFAGQLGRFGITVVSWTSGDSGCGDTSLDPTAIRFTAQGLDAPAPLTIRIYIFRNRETWDRRQADVDTCAGKWATDPATFLIVQASPYVVAGQGPWPTGFADAMRQAIEASVGNGGGGAPDLP